LREGPISIAQEDHHHAYPRIGEGNVQLAVAIEITKRKAGVLTEGARSHPARGDRLQTSLSVTEEDQASAVHDINVAVVIYVSRRDGGGEGRECGSRYWGRERAVSITREE
jgi:hypothetical protein